MPLSTVDSLNTPRSQPRTIAFWLTIAGIAGVLLYLLGPILAPFVLAGLIAYMLDPGVEWLTTLRLGKRRLPRWIAALMMTVAIVLVTLLLVLIIVPVIQKEGSALQQKIPTLLTQLNESVLPWLETKLHTSLRINVDTMRGLVSDKLASDGQDIAAKVFSSVKVGTSAVLGVMGVVFLLPILVFYLLVDWPMLMQRAQQLIPRPWERKAMQLLREIDALLAQFFRGQILVMVVMAAYYAIGLSIAGFEIALPVGIITGLLVFIPYIGYTIGLSLALLAALLQFGNWYGFIAIGVVYGLGQVIESFFLTPRLVGERIGLSPVTVIFALMAFGELFGFVGVLLALPISAVLTVALRELRIQYINSRFYRG